MKFRLVAAGVAWWIMAVGALAQTGVPSGPAEPPPAGFDAAQYVDSAGCVYLRAAVNDQVIWVPRMTAARKPLCGYAPTVMAAAPQVERPVDVIAAPSVARPARTRRVVPKGACGVAAPVKVEAALSGGGTATLCLPKDGRLSPLSTVAEVRGAVPLGEATQGGTVLVCPRTVPVVQRFDMGGGGRTLLCTAGDGGLAGLTVPVRRTQGAEVIEAQGAVRSYVQVGAFVVPANAQRTGARIAALGLPVATGAFSSGRRSFDVIFAGPFDSSAGAQGALEALRAAGFEDAFLR